MAALPSFTSARAQSRACMAHARFAHRTAGGRRRDTQACARPRLAGRRAHGRRASAPARALCPRVPPGALQVNGLVLQGDEPAAEPTRHDPTFIQLIRGAEPVLVLIATAQVVNATEPLQTGEPDRLALEHRAEGEISPRRVPAALIVVVRVSPDETIVDADRPPIAAGDNHCDPVPSAAPTHQPAVEIQESVSGEAGEALETSAAFVEREQDIDVVVRDRFRRRPRERHALTLELSLASGNV